MPPYEYTVLAYDHVEYAEHDGDTGDTEEDEKHNTLNALLEAHDAGLQPSDTTELAGLGGVQDGIVVPLCVVHPVHIHGVVSRGATAETPINHVMRACAYPHQGVENIRVTATRSASLREMWDT